MKKYNILLVMLMALFCHNIAWAQSTPSVMVMDNNSFSSVYRTGLQLKSLLANGTNGEATVEFWIKSEGNNKSWVLSDLQGNSQNFSVSLNSSGSLTISNGSNSQTIAFTGAGGVQVWHHVALVFQNNGAILGVYLNGAKKAEFTNVAPNISAASDLVFDKGTNRKLFFTELRAWTSARHFSEIEANWLKTFVYKSNSELNLLKSNNGLAAVFGANNSSLSSLAHISNIQQLTWTNYLGSVSGVSNGKGSGKTDNNTLLSVRTDVDHPIVNNNLLQVFASKGEFLDKVEVKWGQLSGATGYRIFRDGVLKKVKTDIGSIPVSGDVIWEDDDIIPGKGYSYVVEGFKTGDNAFAPNGTSDGFIPFNGRLAGEIVSQSGIYVEDVQVEALPTDGILPGKAISFGSNAIQINNVSLFRQLSTFTFSFWYKASAPNNTATNGVFQLGAMKVYFQGSNLKATNGSKTISAAIGNDGQWHHYTVTFGSNGAIMQDGISKKAESLPMSLAGSVSSFSFNYQKGSTYYLDECSIWTTAFTAEEVQKGYRHLLSGDEENLALYYRFDLGFPKNVYNLAETTRGYYAGECTSNITYTSAAAQPTNLVYGAYTDAAGNYEMAAMNYGTSSNGVTFRVTPSKPNHEFSPADKEIKLQISTDVGQYQKLDVDFVDISELPIAGKIQYFINNEPYPVPEGQQITLDGTLIAGEDAGTDKDGVFSLSASLGKHLFEVNNPKQNRDFGAKALSFNGTSAYAQSEEVFINSNKATFSGWIRTGSSTALEQSILSTGNLELILTNNNKMAIRIAGSKVLTSTANLPSETWTFFAVRADKTGQTLGIYVGNTLDTQSSVASIDLAGLFTLGARMNNGLPENFFTGHLDQIEFRDEAYTEVNIETIKSGEITTEDDTHLKAVYAFNESLGVKAVSLINGAKDQTLLLNDATRDESVFYTYVRKYQYDYTATNSSYNPIGATYDLNVVTPITSMDFENNTRYGIVGQIVIPCNYTVGQWSGKVVRTDLKGYTFEKTFDHTNFNSNNSVFEIDGLMPGSYRIELDHASLPTLHSPVLEVRDGWINYEFEYRSPLQIEVSIIGRDSISADSNQYQLHLLPLQYAVACNGNYVIEQSQAYRMQVDIFEEYSGNRCYQGDVSYTLNGDLGTAIPKVSGGSSDEFTSNSNGIDTIGFIPNVPNFSTTLDRKFNITAIRGAESDEAIVKAYILGSKQFETDFTLDIPEKIVNILHDPSGDNSSMTWSKDNSVMFNEDYSNDGNVNIGIDFSTGTDVEHYIGNWAGVGGGVLFATKIIDSESKALFKFNQVIGGGSNQSYSYVVSSNQSVSTSGDPKAAGIQSDVYIGYSSVIRMGRGKTLYMDGCEAKVEDNTEVMKTEAQPLFHFTHYEIENSLLPSLRELKTLATDSVEILEYADRITNWEQILQDNIDNRADIDNHEEFGLSNDAGSQSVPSTIVFSGGVGAINYTLNKTDNDSYKSTVSSSTAFEKGFSNSFKVFGVLLKTKSTVKGTYNHSSSSSDGGGSGESYAIKLDDDDIGDQFEMMIKKDPTYGSPIFKTLSGRSRCPYEEFTVPREGVDIDVDRFVVDTLLGSPAIFNLTLTNTQVFNDSVGKSYTLAVSQTSNPNGARILLNGNEFTGTASYFLAPGASTNALISIERGQSDSLNFDDIDFYFYSGCEGSQGTIKYSNLVLPEGVLMRDKVSLSAHFLSPCAESVELASPTDLWVVNSTDNDELPFKFKVNPSISVVDKIRLEYIKGQNNQVLLLEEILTDSLVNKADGQGYYSWIADVSGLSDGAYQFRVTPMCGTTGAAWSISNPSEWVAGNIFREIPVITSVSPIENGIWTSNNITVQYNRTISSFGLNPNNITLKGVLAGVDYDMFAAELTDPADYIQVPEFAQLDLADAYTVEFWVNPSSYPSQEAAILKKGTNFNISLTAAGYLNNGRALSSSQLSPNTWTHVAVVYDGSTTIKTYFDGQEVSSNPFAAEFLVDDSDLEIGKTETNGARFNGAIDEIRIWSTARSDFQIISAMQQMLLGNESNLIAYFPLDNNPLEGEAVRDFAGNATGTTASGINWTSNAAPMEVESVIQEVPITIIHQDDEIVITPKNFPEAYLEGSLLTLNIAEDKVFDEFGNPAKGKAWSFLVNKNAIAWERANESINTSAGYIVDFDMGIMNNGAATAYYRPHEWPAWLTATRNTMPLSTNSTTQLGGNGSVHQIDFQVDATSLPMGQSFTHVIMETFNSSFVPTGYEPFLLEVVKVAPNNVRVTVTALGGNGEASSDDLSDEQATKELVLEQNRPNPMSSQTAFDYYLPEASKVQFTIYDQLGRVVKVLLNAEQNAGTHTLEWNGQGANSQVLPRGIYIYELATPSKRFRKKLVIE